VATTLKGHNDQVKYLAEAIAATAAEDLSPKNTLSLLKVNEISFGLNDTANSSPSGSWTGTSMATADVNTNMVEAGYFSSTSGSSQATNHQATDLYMVTTNQATEMADQFTSLLPASLVLYPCC
jgi:hypothetical protein